VVGHARAGAHAREADAKKTTNGNAKRGTQLPRTFALTGDMRRWAKETFGAGPPLAEEFQRFCDYHRARGSVFRDWEAAWRNWMRKAVEYAEERHGSTAAR
jgi:hypothetical protein